MKTLYSEDMPILHVYGQQFWHDDLRIAGNRAGLLALKQAVDKALGAAGAKPGESAAVCAPFTQNDGEGFDATIEVLPQSEAETLPQAYHDEMLFAPTENRVKPASLWKGRIYVCGPMTGIAEHNFPAFFEAERLLQREGLVVENPANHGSHEWACWADYLRADLPRLATCEAIYLLPGWEQSQGAMLEIHVARALGLSLRYADGAKLVEPVEDTVVAEEFTQEFIMLVMKDALSLRERARGMLNGSGAHPMLSEAVDLSVDYLTGLRGAPDVSPEKRMSYQDLLVEHQLSFSD